MIPDRARELIGGRPIGERHRFGGGYNRNAVRPIRGEIHRAHGREAVDRPIREMGLDTAFGLEPGIDFTRVGLPPARDP